jgi:hypothetical protein
METRALGRLAVLRFLASGHVVPLSCYPKGAQHFVKPVPDSREIRSCFVFSRSCENRLGDYCVMKPSLADMTRAVLLIMHSVPLLRLGVDDLHTSDA